MIAHEAIPPVAPCKTILPLSKEFRFTDGNLKTVTETYKKTNGTDKNMNGDNNGINNY